MALSIEEMRALAFGLRKEGLNSQQIADELSLSQDTISWLLTEGSAGERPTDVRIGWRSIGVRPERIAAIGTIMADIADEELGASDIDTIVGISINGISFAHEVARCLGSEYTIYRNVEGDDGHGVLSNKYGQVSGKKVVIIDDVLSSGTTLGKTIESIRAAGGEVGLAIVLINKTTRNEVDGVPLRGIIRAVAV
ncbi:MAG: orotate phosphoribosyltransferase-like protein [Euryarchaeota archaeon]|jgi:orotate phosphoribosyltransferase|nr:orotate phosphoribosyltransferase-like protein [Euryarchaeota archaeon]MBT6641301.1 orotate phosphoribosyltransferase-like protein [Euryarchaeota archaeon]